VGQLNKDLCCIGLFKLHDQRKTSHVFDIEVRNKELIQSEVFVTVAVIRELTAVKQRERERERES
jgi:hypothetical protein